MNKAAQALGRLSRGKPKNFSKAELQRRRERFKKYAIPARWAENDLAKSKDTTEDSA